MSIKEKITHQKLTLDVNQNDCLSTLEMKQGDKLSRFIDITLVASGKFIDLSELADGKTAKIIASMNGELRQNSTATINDDGTVTVEMDENALGEAGVLDCEIRITDSKGGVLSSALFLIRVGRSAVGKFGKVVDALKGIVSLDMCNEELLNGIVPVLSSPDENAEKYSNLLLNVGDNTVFIAHPSFWTDSPSTEAGVFINRHYSNNYDVQLYIELTSGNMYTRIVDSASSGDASIYRDWLSVETHVNDIVKMNIKQSTLASATEGILAKINDNFVFSCSASQGWTDMPTTSGGVFTNQRYGTNFNIQYFVQQTTGYMWTRIVDRRTGVPYRDWVDITDREWVADIVKMCITQTALAKECEGLLSNIKDNIIMSCSISAGWTDKPTSTGSVFINLRYGTNYNIQFDVNQSTGVIWRRIVNRNTGAIYDNWKQPDGTPLMNILALGDSICRGVRNSNKGFVGDLGFPYKNIGVSSATISNVTTSVTNIPDQLVNLKTDEPDYAPDIIIAEGGINDWSKNAVLGQMFDNKGYPIAQDEVGMLNRSSVIGSLEYLFYKMITLYPNAQRFFLITHKTYKASTGAYCPTTANSAGWTQQDLHDAIVQCCKVYNVKVIDVYEDSMINTYFSQYRSEVAYNDDNSVTDTQYVDADGVHPLAYGYKEGYVPHVKKAIGIGTAK